MACQEVMQKKCLLIHWPRHFDFLSSVCGHFQVTQKRGIGDGTLAEAISNLLHSILNLLLCHAVLDIIKQRELLGAVFGGELDGTDGGCSNFCVP